MPLTTIDQHEAAWPVILTDPVNRRHPLNQGRVAWWLILPGIDGGRQWFDLMGTNHGVLTGMANTSNGWRNSVQPGALAGCILGDGVNGYIEAPRAPVTSAPLTLIAWAKLTAVPSVNSTESILLSIGKKSGIEEWWIGYYRTSGGVNQLRAIAQGSNGAAVLQVTATPTFDTGWHRVGAVFTSSTAATIYLDGRPLSAGTTGTATPAAVDTAWIGGLVYSGTTVYGQFNGQLNDATVFNRALSAGEMWADYELSRTGYPGVLNRLAPAAAPIVGTVYLVSESAGMTEAPTSAATLGITEAPIGTDTPTSAASLPLFDSAVSVATCAAAATFLPTEAGGTDDSGLTLIGALIVADVAAGAEALSYSITSLSVGESWAADDAPSVAAAWTWTDTFGETDTDLLFNLLTPLTEDFDWSEGTIGVVPTYQVSESPLWDDQPTWAAWSLFAVDTLGGNGDRATLASVYAVTDSQSSLTDDAGYVSPVLFVGETFAGTDAATLLPILACLDSATGSDLAALAATWLPSDAAAAAATPTLAALFLPTDQVPGNDLPTLAATLTARDAGMESDALQGIATGLVAESVPATDRAAAAASWLSSDVGTAADAQALASVLPTADAGQLAPELLAGAATLQPAERWLGSEVYAGTAAWFATDALGGSIEAPRLASAWTLTEADVWLEAIGDIHLFVTMTEWWVPSELPTLLATLQAAESGTAADLPTLASRLNPADGPGMADLVSVASVLAPQEAPAWLDAPSLATLDVIADAGLEQSTLARTDTLPTAEALVESEALTGAATWLPRETATATDVPTRADSLVIVEAGLGRDALFGSAALSIGESATPVESALVSAFLFSSEALTIGEDFTRSDVLPIGDRGSWLDLESATAVLAVGESGLATDAASGRAAWGVVEGPGLTDTPALAGAWQVAERPAAAEAPGLSPTWLLEESSTGRDVGLLAYVLSWSDSGGLSEEITSKATWGVLELLEQPSADLSLSAQWMASDSGFVADRPSVAGALLWTDSAQQTESGRLATTLPLLESPILESDLFASAAWFAAEGVPMLESPTATPTLPPSRQDTHLHSRITPVAGLPDAPRARVVPSTPSSRVVPVPGIPDPSRSTIQ